MIGLLSNRQRITRRVPAAVLAGLLLVLGGCQNASAPAASGTPTPLAFTMLADLVMAGRPANDQAITTIGYLLIQQSGATLVDLVAFDRSGVPQPLHTGTTPIWIAADARAQAQKYLRAAGNIQFAAVIARGRLAGPAAFGPNDQYQYQLRDPEFEPLATQETTIADMLARPAIYDQRIVRVVGGLLVRGGSALLVDQLNPGGIPAPKARQIKLRGSLGDPELLARLHSPANQIVHFGQVQIEGLWRAGILVPLAITLVT